MNLHVMYFSILGILCYFFFILSAVCLGMAGSYDREKAKHGIRYFRAFLVCCILCIASFGGMIYIKKMDVEKATSITTSTPTTPCKP